MPLGFPAPPDGPGGVDILQARKRVADEEIGVFDSGVMVLSIVCPYSSD